MKVIVLMATYEGERYICQQMDSILGQTLKELKLMVSDDGSKDKTREILKEYRNQYPDRIVLKHRVQEEDYQNKEQVSGAAMNFFWLLAQASGDYILFSDQDDVWKREKAEKLLKHMKKLEKRLGKDYPILVHSDMEVTDEDLNMTAPSFFDYQHCNPKRTSFAEVLVENPVTGGGAMINKALADLLLKVPEACCMHDWWMALTASCFGTISCIREPLYQYRQHENNVLGAKATGSLEDIKQRARRQAQVEENYRKMFAQAAAFGKMYHEQMSTEQKNILRSFLALPLQSPAGRLHNIVKNHFFKTSLIQTLAQSVTIPGRER
ncbi:MAG: glycosyltransferase family 2 protein [Hungatella sp.]|nr:glycosyltransferase family 2 protein [Hungatella sp.]